MTKVSIIIPTFNAERYIGQVIDNILSQTFNEWELIIVDDGSTDKTEEIVRAVCDPRIQFILRNRQPKGSATCRNIGQMLAKGEYFIHFDADDFIAPFCLKQRINYMDNHPDIDFATFHGSTVISGQDGKYVETDKKWGYPLSNDDLGDFLSTNYPYSVWNNIYRTSSFIGYLWDEKVKIYTDFSYIVPCLVAGKKHGYDQDSMADYIYRMGQSNAMTQSFISDEKYVSTKYLFSKTLDSLSQTSNPYYYKNRFYNFFKLQFRRLINEGTLSQEIDFFNFLTTAFPEKRNLSFKCAFYLSRIIRTKKCKNERKILKGISLFFLQPKEIWHWLMSRIKRQSPQQ